MKSTFLRYVSHEMRSPLAVAIAYLQFMIEDSSSKVLPIQFLENSKQALSSCEAAVLVLNDVLSYEAIMAGKFSVSCDYVPVVSAIQQSCRAVSGAAFAKQINFTFEDRIPLTHGGYFVYVDVPKLNQVIRNLIVNAVKFTSFGGSIAVVLSFDNNPLISEPPGHINRKVQPSDIVPCGHFIIDITDDGIGIAAEDLEKVFGQFVQFDANNLQGTPYLILKVLPIFFRHLFNRFI